MRVYREAEWSEGLAARGVQFLYDEEMDIVLVPVEPCESFSPESERHCHNPKGHDGAHEAYMAYGYGVFHTVSWAHTLEEDEAVDPAEWMAAQKDKDEPVLGDRRRR